MLDAARQGQPGGHQVPQQPQRQQQQPKRHQQAQGGQGRLQLPIAQVFPVGHGYQEQARLGYGEWLHPQLALPSLIVHGAVLAAAGEQGRPQLIGRFAVRKQVFAQAQARVGMKQYLTPLVNYAEAEARRQHRPAQAAQLGAEKADHRRGRGPPRDLSPAATPGQYRRALRVAVRHNRRQVSSGRERISHTVSAGVLHNILKIVSSAQAGHVVNLFTT